MVCYMDPQVVRSQLVSTENAELYEENVQKSMLGTQCMLMSATGIIIDFIFLCVRLQDSWFLEGGSFELKWLSMATTEI